MVITIANNKGGVAKTTTTVNTAAALVQLGKRVLVVDTDAQGNAGHYFGVPVDASPSVTDVLLDGVELSAAIHKTDAGVDVVPASFELAHADVSLADVPGRAKVLRHALASVRRRYDFILVDTPPSLGLVVVNAIVAADAVLVPVVPHPMVLGGLARLLKALDEIKAGTGAGGVLLGIVLTMCDYRQGVTRQVVEAIRGHFGGKVFTAEVRQSVKLVEAPYFHTPVMTYAGTSTGAEAYTDIAREIIRRTKQ